MKMRKTVILAAAALLLTGCGAAPAGDPPQAPVTQQVALRREESLPAMLRRVSPGVVGIAVTLGNGAGQGLGSGFLAGEGGLLLTNYHVAGEAETIQVVTQEGARYPARRLWGDAVLDLAVLRCDALTGAPLALGSAAALSVGDTVAAIGTPLDFSFQHTVTAGIVSGMHRTLQVPTEQGLSFLEELVQTDAPINPGNSGGPLVNAAGEVVGINTVKVEDAEGLGFAIPIDLAKPILARIRETGAFTAPYVGVTVLDRDIARYYGREVEEGLLALKLDPEGPAAKAGLREGDVLLSVEDTSVATVLAFRQALYAHAPGDRVTLTARRGSETVTAECVLTGKNE